MRYDELVRRVYQARDQIMRAGGTNVEAWTVYTSIEDLMEVKTDRALIESGRFMESGFEIAVVGLRIRPDRNLRPGEVRLRTEVAA